MPIYEGKAFRNVTVELKSGNVYRHCTFEDCIYEFDGTGGEISDSTLNGGAWRFVGAAENTIAMLGDLWRTGATPAVATVIGQIIGDQNAAASLVQDAHGAGGTMQ
jgi:hypothetical protein